MRPMNRNLWPAIMVALGVGVTLAGLALLGLRLEFVDTKDTLAGRIDRNASLIAQQAREIDNLQTQLALTRAQLAQEKAARAEQDRLIRALQDQVRGLGGDPITSPPPEPSPSKQPKPKPSKSPKPRPTHTVRPSSTPCPVPLPVCPVILGA